MQERASFVSLCEWHIQVLMQFFLLQEEEGFLDALDEDEDAASDDEGGEGDEEEGLPLIPDRELDFMPDIDGSFAPTVREPWRSERELKRVKGRSKKGGRKTSSRRR